MVFGQFTQKIGHSTAYTGASFALCQAYHYGSYFSWFARKISGTLFFLISETINLDA